MKELILIRYNKTQDFTEGEFFLADTGDRVCDTLEDKIVDANGNGVFDGDEKKVYGESAIPYGEYELEATYSPKFKKQMVLLKDVPHFSGIRMHWAANASHLEGCIGVGKKTSDGVLENIGMTDSLANILIKNGNKGKIVII